MSSIICSLKKLQMVKINYFLKPHYFNHSHMIQNEPLSNVLKLCCGLRDDIENCCLTQKKSHKYQKRKVISIDSLNISNISNYHDWILFLKCNKQMNSNVVPCCNSQRKKKSPKNQQSSI